MTVEGRRAALWIRVSTDDQDPDVQLELLRDWAARRGFVVAMEYRLTASGWSGEHHTMLRDLYAAAARGDFDVVFVQALDRLGREGAAATLTVWRRLQGYGVAVASYREPFVESISSVAGDALAELLVMLTGWIARQESELISKRTKAGLEKRRRAGKPLGRPAGAKDRRPRRRRGYFDNRNAARAE